MDAVFLKLLNLSLTASWLCLAVLLVRLLLKKAPKAISCALWALVGLRLLFPFSIESMLSLIPSAEPLPEDMLLSPTPTINSGIPVINEVVNPVISDSLAPNPGDSVNPMQVITTVAGYVWLVGMAAMLVYMLVTYLRVRRKVAEAVKIEGNVYECDHVDTPFILGVIRPRIYLPSSMSDSDRAFVIAHEQAHLRRLDHVWKPLGFLLLTVYWFNPLLWLGYILLCRDIELACDEKVIRQLGTDIKKQYSEALINCSVPRRAISACPLAFGEVGVKGRIKSVLNYKKPAFWIILVAVVALVVTGVCFLTDPPTPKIDSELDAYVSQIILEQEAHMAVRDGVMFEAHTIYGVAEEGDTITVYLGREYSEFTCEDGILSKHAAGHGPIVIKLKQEAQSYSLIEYIRPNDGSLYGPSIREMFPWHLQRKAFSTYKLARFHGNITGEKARNHWNLFHASGNLSEEQSWFYATVLKTNDDAIYIEAFENTYEALFNNDDSFSVSTDLPFFQKLPALKAGDTIKIVYTGGISSMRSISTIKNPLSITLANIDDDSNQIPTLSNFTFWNFEATPEFTLPEFENIKFVYNGAIHMVDRAGKETELISGTVVIKAGFADLNGDGYNEFLGQANIGSGYIHEFIVVYDIKNDRFYRLDDRFSYDFYLTDENDTLSVTIHDVRSNSSGIYQATPFLVKRGDDYVLELRNGSDVLYRSYADGTQESLLPDCVVSYVFHPDNDWMKRSSVTLFEDQTFQFIFSPVSSYLGNGKYEIKDDCLILSTDDGKFTYIFEMHEDRLVYRENVNGYHWMGHFTDGSEFIKQN